MRFTPQEQSVLRAAVDRILPSDDHPGAWDAGAAEYLERQLDATSRDARVVKGRFCRIEAESGRDPARASSAFAEARTRAARRESGAGREWTVWPEILPGYHTTGEGVYSDPGKGQPQLRPWA